MRVFRAGVVYFALVFAVGWILGPIRVLWVIPRVGVTAGVLLEAPFMLAAMILAARWVVRRLNIPATFRPRLTMGLVALGCLLAAEFGSAIWLRQIPFLEYLAGFATISGLVTLVLFLLFAAMPALLRRR